MNGGDNSHQQNVTVSDDSEIREMLSSNDDNTPTTSKKEIEAGKEKEINIRKIIFYTMFMKKVYNDVPIAEEYLDLALELYDSVKESNCFSKCMLERAEETIYKVLEDNSRCSKVFKLPLRLMHIALIYTLDLVEECVPAIKLKRDEMVDFTVDKIEYVTTGRCALEWACKIVEKSSSLLLCKDIKVSYTKGEPPCEY